MAYEMILTETQGRVGIITFNRPAFKEAVRAFLEKRQPDFHKE